MASRKNTTSQEMVDSNDMTEEEKKKFTADKLAIGMRNISFVMPLTAITFFGGYYFIPFRVPAMNSFEDRLRFTVQWQVIPILSIFKAIFGVIAIRASTPACDPIEGKSEHLIRVPQNILQNTIEQYIVYFIGQVMLCSYLTSESMKAVPLFAVIFLIARTLFANGYSSGETIQRSWGFGPTYFTTCFVYMYCLMNFLSGGLSGILY